MTQIWITKTSDKNLQIRYQDLADDIESLSLTLADNKMLLNEYKGELAIRGLIKIETETSKKPVLNIADVSGRFSADDMLKMALFINEQAWCKSSENGKWVSMYDDVGCEDDEFVEMWTDNYH